MVALGYGRSLKIIFLTKIFWRNKSVAEEETNRKRIVWIEIFNMLLHAWNEENYCYVAKVWETTIKMEDNFLEGSNRRSAKVIDTFWVATIQGRVVLDLDGAKFDIFVIKTSAGDSKTNNDNNNFDKGKSTKMEKHVKEICPSENEEEFVGAVNDFSDYDDSKRDIQDEKGELLKLQHMERLAPCKSSNLIRCIHDDRHIYEVTEKILFEKQERTKVEDIEKVQ
ncbi:uncharacterized protein DS421_15g508810 [Arachis hypogaea]|nr:uncharacterized protein LOC112750696 [Arachis hypogaea]XP_025655295.1 uncharacterized protein LOC112750696 [Arachis hypogaea]QHO12655.1 uncharacterized protein DS421_15g508810 [Arachis hypogaea]